MKKIWLIGGAVVVAALLYKYYTSSNRYEVVEDVSESEPEVKEEEEIIFPRADYMEVGLTNIKATELTIHNNPIEFDYSDPESISILQHPVWDPSFIGYILSEYAATFKSVRDNEEENNDDMYARCLLENVDNAELWGIFRGIFDIVVPIPALDTEITTTIYRLRGAFADDIYSADPRIRIGEVLIVLVNLMTFMHEALPEECVRYLFSNGNAFNSDFKDTEKYFLDYFSMSTSVPNIFGLQMCTNAETILTQFAIYHEEFTK